MYVTPLWLRVRYCNYGGTVFGGASAVQCSCSSVDHQLFHRWSSSVAGGRM